MALIKCPECKKKISDASDVCVHCGYKIKRTKDSEYELSYDVDESYDSPSKRILKALGIILGVLLAAAAIALVVYIWLTYEQNSFLKNAIMMAAAIVSFLVGGAAAILCKKLL